MGFLSIGVIEMLFPENQWFEIIFTVTCAFKYVFVYLVNTFKQNQEWHV